MGRDFHWVEYVGIVVLLMLVFPLAIWVYLNPLYLICPSFRFRVKTR